MLQTIQVIFLCMFDFEFPLTLMSFPTILCHLNVIETLRAKYGHTIIKPVSEFRVK